METFEFTTPNFTLTEKPRILTAQFGDGYQQDSADGLNSRLQTWQLTFDDIYPSIALKIRAFFVARGGVEPFYWTTPAPETLIFKCQEWQIKPAKKERLTVTCTFKQVPA